MREAARRRSAAPSPGSGRGQLPSPLLVPARDFQKQLERGAAEENRQNAHGLRDQSAALASAEPEPEQQAAADEAGRLVPRSTAEG